MTLTAAVIAASSGAAASQAYARVFWECVSGLIELIAIIRAISVSALAWEYRGWSKLAAVIISAWITLHLGILTVPVGAIAVIWHTRTISRRYKTKSETPPQVPDLPYAESNHDQGDRQ